MGNNGRFRRDRDREFDDRDEGNRWGDRENIHQPDRYATGQSGYNAGRDADRALGYQSRNQGYSGGYEDRQAFGTDDRFTGRTGGDDYAGWRGDRDRDRQRFAYRDQRDDDNRGYSGQGSMYGYGRNSGGYGGSSHQGDYGPSESERGVWQSDMGYGAQGRGQGRSGGYTQDEQTSSSFQTGGFNNQTGWGIEGGRGVQRAQERGNESSRERIPRGEHRGKGPRGYQRSDERIKENVCEALTDDDLIDASNIDIEVKNGEVTLSGMVPDRQTKRWAEDVVWRVSGVKDVSIQLKISADERDRMGRSNQGANGAVGTQDMDSNRNGKDDGKKARA